MTRFLPSPEPILPSFIRSLRAAPSLLAALLAAGVALPLPAHAESAGAAFPRPKELEPDVEFWIRVYTEVGRNGGFVHDSRDLGVVYEVLRFPEDASRRTRERMIESAKRGYRDALRQLASGKRTGLSAEQARVLALWPAGVSNGALHEASSRLRFQLGQADKFRAGLIRAGAWRDHIHETFREMGLPEELAALPHVESSYTPHAYSHVGAAGLWQFTRSTGRRYMRVDHVVDERLDPHRSTVAAARLLKHNYEVTGTWPLALTAYNHGASGMRRATRKLGTTDITTIAREYKGRTFGFASRNFYVEFLAALEIDSNPEKYFGLLPLEQPTEFELVELPYYASASAVAETLGVDIATLEQANPSLRPAVWSGDKRIPKGHELRVPSGVLAKPLATLIAQVPESGRFAAQTRDTYHKVQRGESLSVIAARYRTSIRELASLNNLHSQHRIRAGQLLRLPEAAASRGSSRDAASQPAAVTAKVDEAPAAEAPASGIYTVRRGDTLQRIAERFGVSEERLIEWNHIRNRHRIARGQKLRVTASSAIPASLENTPAPEPAVATESDLHPEAPTEFTEPPAARTEIAASDAAADTTPDGAADVGVAAVEESYEDALLADTIDLKADPSDYSVAADGTIEIQAAETLGHYAEWLDVRASRLRQLNHMSYGTPLAIGGRLKLDFARTSPQAFEARRLEHHRELQGEFFANNEIVGTSTHRIRSGDSIWQLAQRTYDLPLWLIRQYNPDVDFGELRSGDQITIPTLRKH